MAGLYDVWNHPNGYMISSYTIITKEAQKDIATIHNRMPVILPQKHLDKWLKTVDYSFSKVLEIAKDSRPTLGKYSVSSLVNSARNNSSDCILPVADVG